MGFVTNRTPHYLGLDLLVILICEDYLLCPLKLDLFITHPPSVSLELSNNPSWQNPYDSRVRILKRWSMRVSMSSLKKLEQQVVESCLQIVWWGSLRGVCPSAFSTHSLHEHYFGVFQRILNFKDLLLFCMNIVFLSCLPACIYEAPWHWREGRNSKLHPLPQDVLSLRSLHFAHLAHSSQLSWWSYSDMK